MVRSTMVALIVCMMPIQAVGQEQGSPTPASVLAVGTRVRLRSSAIQGQMRGVVASLDDKALTLTGDGDRPVVIPLDSITALDASRGRRRNALQGLAIGAVSGALLGLTFKVDSQNCYDSDNFCSRGEAVGAGSFFFGVLGAGIGALVKSDRWGAVVLTPGKAHAARSPSGFGLLVTVRF